MAELQYWVWLSMRGAVRPEVLCELLSHCDGARTLYYAQKHDLAGLGVRLRPSEERALLDKDMDAAERALEVCERMGVSVLTLRDAAYPARLKRISGPPPVLYVLGRLPMMDEHAAVAVVGTRRASDYGVRTARRFGAELARSGALLVSGMTDGIDGAAALGALEAGGSVVGVTGKAIDDGFGGALAERVARQGAVVGEFAPGDRAIQGFRRRNRITAGLALAAVVVEAPAKSGALLFADETVAQSKEVFVVPGNVDAACAAGSNALLMDGARPASRAWDVLADHAVAFPALREPEDAVSEPVAERSAPQKGIDKEKEPAYIDMEKLRTRLTEPQLLIVAVLTEGQRTLDEIAEQTALSSSAAMAELTMLQIMGLVRQESGKRYALCLQGVK